MGELYTPSLDVSELLAPYQGAYDTLASDIAGFGLDRVEPAACAKALVCALTYPQRAALAGVLFGKLADLEREYNKLVRTVADKVSLRGLLDNQLTALESALGVIAAIYDSAAGAMLLIPAECNPAQAIHETVQQRARDLGRGKTQVRETLGIINAEVEKTIAQRAIVEGAFQAVREQIATLLFAPCGD